MKIIYKEINKCTECPYYELRTIILVDNSEGKKSFCNRMGSDKSLDCLPKIPDWCPLPDGPLNINI